MNNREKDLQDTEKLLSEILLLNYQDKKETIMSS